jgi:uncharacterized protein
MMHRYVILCLGALALSSISLAKQMNARDFFKTEAQVSLAEAAAEGHTGKLEVLVSSGADVNAQGIEGMTTLLWAVLQSSKAGASWLLEHGADPNVVFVRDGSCATSIAAAQEDPEYLTEILAHGGNVNIRNPLNGRTPLNYAIVMQRNDNVRMLISHGADMGAIDHLGSTPLIEAAQAQRYELVYDMLLAGADPTQAMPKWKGMTLLSVIRQSHVPPGTPAHAWRGNVIELLKQRGLDVASAP